MPRFAFLKSSAKDTVSAMTGDDDLVYSLQRQAIDELSDRRTKTADLLLLAAQEIERLRSKLSRLERWIDQGTKYNPDGIC